MKPIMWGVTDHSGQIEGDTTVNASENDNQSQVLSVITKQGMGLASFPLEHREQEVERHGETEDQEEQIGHCSFTAGLVTLPVQGRKYR